jgi:hypothetical protein
MLRPLAFILESQLFSVENHPDGNIEATFMKNFKVCNQFPKLGFFCIFSCKLITLLFFT